jgi:hypothetical protein
MPGAGGSKIVSNCALTAGSGSVEFCIVGSTGCWSGRTG